MVTVSIVFLTEKGGLGWPSREDITGGSHLLGREKERRRGKCEKALDTIASHGLDDFLDSYRSWPTTRRIRALDVTHNQHNVQNQVRGQFVVAGCLTRKLTTNVNTFHFLV
jgi:hypothetical protein